MDFRTGLPQPVHAMYRDGTYSENLGLASDKDDAVRALRRAGFGRIDTPHETIDRGWVAFVDDEKTTP